TTRRLLRAARSCGRRVRDGRRRDDRARRDQHRGGCSAVRSAGEHRVTRHRQVVGFDRTLELTWMDATAGFVADGLGTADVRRRLFEYLEGIVPGDTPHTQRGKTITVLTRI